MEIVVRRVERGDVAAVADLLDGLVGELTAARGGPEVLRDHLDLVRAAARGDLTLLGRDPTEPSDGRRLVVGTIDGVVVGMASARYQLTTEGRRGVVDCCYVEPGARRVGVGEALLADVVGWLGRTGCDAVDAAVLPGRRDGKSLLEATGFKARLIVMHRPL
ncbi:MAG: GNAT family N-acetyltransferase [Acidimicrobiales bacterium]